MNIFKKLFSEKKDVNIQPLKAEIEIEAGIKTEPNLKNRIVCYKLDYEIPIEEIKKLRNCEAFKRKDTKSK